MDTSCAAGACWKLLLACSCVGFLTQFSHVHLRKPVMSCNRGRVISVWIVESDVRGKRKLVKFQTKRAKVRGSLAATQNAIKTFRVLFSFLLFLKALTPSKWLTWTGCCFFWHLWLWAEIYHYGVIVILRLNGTALLNVFSNGMASHWWSAHCWKTMRLRQSHSFVTFKWALNHQ